MHFGRRTAGAALVIAFAAALFGRGPRGAKAASRTVPAGPPTPVLLELYTSEGCSSCPPADSALRRLSAAGAVPGVLVIPLAFHVDYWNDLGWPDPFSSQRFTARQRVYGAALGQRGVYTPEAIVDGAVHFVGSDEDRAELELASARDRPHAKVQIEDLHALGAQATRHRVHVASLPSVGAGESAEVWLARTEDGLVVDVPRGENAGRRLEHDAVVRALVRLGELHGEEGTLEGELPAVAVGARTHVVAFVQERVSRRVLGAAQK